MLVFCKLWKSLYGESVPQVEKIVQSRANLKYRFEKCVNHSLKMKANPQNLLLERIWNNSYSDPPGFFLYPFYLPK